MKKRLIVVLVLIGLLTGVCWAINLVHSETRTPQIKWQIIDTTTSAGAETTDLAVDERTYATVVAAMAAATAGVADGEISIYRIPDSHNAGRFRCGGIAADGTATYQIYLGTLALRGTDCDLVNAGQLAFVVGTQESSIADCNLADAVTVTQYCWPKSWGSASPGSELVAEASLDFMGADILIIVPTTASANSWLFMKGF